MSHGKLGFDTVAAAALAAAAAGRMIGKTVCVVFETEGLPGQPGGQGRVDAYREISIAKRWGKRRILYEPDPVLKAHQRAILRDVLMAAPVHDCVHGFVRGRGPATNAAVHVGSEVIVKLDLENFFPTITRARIAGVFRSLRCNPGEAARLARMCTWEGRLPQGAPTSPTLSNLVCWGLDRRLAGLAGVNGWRFTRYADDLTFSRVAGVVGLGVEELVELVGRIVREEGFRLNRRKTTVLGAGGRQSVTGLVVNGDDRGPRLSRKVKRQIRAGLHNAANGNAGEDPDRLVARRAYGEHVEHPRRR